MWLVFVDTKLVYWFRTYTNESNKIIFPCHSLNFSIQMDNSSATSRLKKRWASHLKHSLRSPLTISQSFIGYLQKMACEMICKSRTPNETCTHLQFVENLFFNHSYWMRPLLRISIWSCVLLNLGVRWMCSQYNSRKRVRKSSSSNYHAQHGNENQRRWWVESISRSINVHSSSIHLE